jgi:hypothetical protein
MKIIRTGLGDTGEGKHEYWIRGRKREDWTREGKDEDRTR